MVNEYVRLICYEDKKKKINILERSFSETKLLVTRNDH